MIIDSGVLADVAAGLKALFYESLRAEKSLWSSVATEMPSTGAEEQYGWLGEVPMVREFLDEREIQNLRSFDFTIRNRKWESTISVDRDTIEDDKLALVRPRVADLAGAVGRHYDRLVFALLPAGFAAACYDGECFFDVDHPTDAGTQSNDAGAVAFAAAALETGVEAMYRFTDRRGEPLGISPDTLVYGPQLWKEVRDVLGPEYLANGASNLNRGLLTPIMSPYITDKSWYLLDNSRAVRALILQKRAEAEFVSQENPETSDASFMRDEFRYGVRARHNAGYALWQLAYGSEGA